MKAASIGDITKSTSSYTVNHVHDCKVPFNFPHRRIACTYIYLIKLKATLDNNNYTNTNSKFSPFVMYVCKCNLTVIPFFSTQLMESLTMNVWNHMYVFIVQLKRHKIINV